MKYTINGKNNLCIPQRAHKTLFYCCYELLKYFNKLVIWKIVLENFLSTQELSEISWWFGKYQAFENQINFLHALTVLKDLKKVVLSVALQGYCPGNCS